MQRILLTAALLIALLLATTSFLRAEPSAARPPTKWEYKTLVATPDSDLSSLGDEGWELVWVVFPNPTNGNVYFYFKRMK
jgi:hypothetical protein